MSVQKTFGRRNVAEPRRAPSRAPAVLPIPTVTAASPPPDEPPIDVDAEVEAWNMARKAKKRSFREPWRTLAIVSSIGFGLSTWLLPESVAQVIDYLTLGLCGASFYAGLRTRRPVVEQENA